MGLENKIAWGVAKASLPVVTLLYKVEVVGLEKIDFGASGLIVSKHRSNIDVPHLVNIFPKRLEFLAQKGLFRFPGIAQLLKLGGAHPITRQWDVGYEHNNMSNINAYRRFFEFLKNGGWYAVFPEGTRVPNGIGKIYPQMIIKAGDYGVPIYLAGIRYSRTEGVYLPGTTVRLEFEEYKIPGKNGYSKEERMKIVAEDVAKKLERLSGLDKKIAEASPTGDYR